MLAVAVMFGAAACTEDGADIVGNGTETFSFIAEIEQTRTDVVESGDDWQAVWSGDDKLFVTCDQGSFSFANSAEELNRFVSTDANASALRNAKNIVITTQHENGSVVDSDAGKRGLSLRKEYELFPEEGKVSLGVESAFLRLACDYNVTISADAAIFSGVNGSKNIVADVTLKAGNDIWVALTPRVEKVSLTATIAGKMELCVEEIVLAAGGLYDLGKIVPEVAPEPEPGPEPEGGVVYLVPNEDWKSADAWFAAYLWDDSNSVNVKLTDEDGDGIYVATIPENMTNIIFCRMNPAYTEFAWNNDTESDHVWTQTADLTVGVAPNNYYYITGWTTGEWNNAGYTPEPPAANQSTWAVAGSFNGWSDTLMFTTDVANLFVAQNMELNSGDQFKVKVAGSWDKNFGGGITNLMPNKWMKGYQDGSDIVVAQSGVYDIYLAYAEGDNHGKIYLIEAGGDYTTATEQTTNGSLNPGGTEPDVPTTEFKIYVYKHNNWATINLYTWDDAGALYTGAWPGSAATTTEAINGFEYLVWAMPATASGMNLNVILNNGNGGTGNQTADFVLGALDKDYYLLLDGDVISFIEDKENPVETPDQPENPGDDFVGVASEWALLGAFSGWADQTMSTTVDANVVVLKEVTLNAGEGFLVRKPTTDWADKYGAGDVNYIKANHYIVTAKDGADMCVEANGLYDVYFNFSNHNLYVVDAGANYTAAAKQTVNGEEPKQEEPEVTDKVVYLKPSTNWKESNARFAAYFWDNSGNVWVSMTDCGDGTYEVHLPEGYDYGCNIIFCRMNPGTTANNWNNKWNQTSDLKTPTDGKNMYTVTEGTWDNGGGSWSTK